MSDPAQRPSDPSYEQRTLKGGLITLRVGDILKSLDPRRPQTIRVTHIFESFFYAVDKRGILRAYQIRTFVKNYGWRNGYTHSKKGTSQDGRSPL